jgi:hypothetical protein
MRLWFLSRFEDPAQQTPYSSDEGYIFVYGGPYDPNDVIQERFSHVISYDVMAKLIAELYIDVGDQWAPIEAEADFYDHELSFRVINRDEPFQLLRDRLNQIDAVLEVECLPPVSEIINQMVHSSLIAALEAYLADTVVYWVKHDGQVLRQFISCNLDFKKRTLTLDQLFDRLDSLDNEVEEYLQKLIWHRLDKIKPMMQAGLGISVPEIDQLMVEVVIRHDVMHRAGRTQEGNKVYLSKEDVFRVRVIVHGFCKTIEEELGRRFPPEEDDDLSLF